MRPLKANHSFTQPRYFLDQSGFKTDRMESTTLACGSVVGFSYCLEWYTMQWALKLSAFLSLSLSIPLLAAIIIHFIIIYFLSILCLHIKFLSLPDYCQWAIHVQYIFWLLLKYVIKLCLMAFFGDRYACNFNNDNNKKKNSNHKYNKNYNNNNNET